MDSNLRQLERQVLSDGGDNDVRGRYIHALARAGLYDELEAFDSSVSNLPLMVHRIKSGVCFRCKQPSFPCNSVYFSYQHKCKDADNLVLYDLVPGGWKMLQLPSYVKWNMGDPSTWTTRCIRSNG